MVMQTDARPRAHVWRFFRAGGFDQVRLDSGQDVAALAELDQKLWVALACPTRGVEFDTRTLDLIDADHDGRIRAPEILGAAQWATSLLKDLDGLAKGRDTLPLAAINNDLPEGKELAASAATILHMLGKADAAAVSLQDTVDIERIYDRTAFNGDGIIPADAAEDEATRAAIAAIIGCIGSELDRSGKPGISRPLADRFFAEATAYVAWRAEAEASAATILPLGDATEGCAALVREIGVKLDDFFTRCRLAAFDGDAAAALNPPRALYEALAVQTLAIDRPEIRALPIAHIAAEDILPLDHGVNPAWADALRRFRSTVVVPLIGERQSLAEADWIALKARFVPYQTWLARRPETPAAQLGLEPLRRLLGGSAKAQIDALIARDQALEPAINAIARVEKLLRYQRDLLPLLNNMVSFRPFYTRSGKASFQAGTLYLDGRSCDLCVAVTDEAKHAQLATLSRIYLAYCVCTRQGVEKMTIAAAFTAGDADNLLVGRNGVFYDRKGRDWDATIVKIIEHPISLRQAFWLPYKQLGRFVGEQAQKLAAARAAGAQMQTTKAVAETAAGQAPAAAPAAQQQQQAFDAARMAGIFAAIGLAIGAIGTAIASVVTGFLHLSWWQMPLAVGGIILMISGPSMVIAALKLRHRNLGPILDACGWAVNARLAINLPFGTALTALARLPERAERSLNDPYAEKRRPWGVYIAIAAVAAALAAAWQLGAFDRWLGG
jgi:hypothetical protein